MPRRPPRRSATSNPRGKRKTVARLRHSEQQAGLRPDATTLRLLTESLEARSWFEEHDRATFLAWRDWFDRQRHVS